jgi:hypothetical protein
MRARLLLIVVAIGSAAAPFPPALVERFYSTSIFPVIQSGVTATSNLSPIALLDLLLAFAAAWLVWTCARLIAARRNGWGPASLVWMARMLTAAALAYLAFLALWGLNYRRIPLAERVRFDAGRVTPAAAHALALTAVEQMNVLYSHGHENDVSRSAIDPALARGFAEAQRVLGVTRPARPGRPKRSILDIYFRSAGVEGMTDPYFLETLVASELLPFERPEVIAHEWSHLAGFVDEGEANFVGWLTCMKAAEPARYSGWLFLYGEVAAVLKPAERAEVSSRLADGPRQDLREIADRVRRQLRPLVATAGWQVYDRYLKANRVDSGVRSYAGVVRLVLGVNLE